MLLCLGILLIVVGAVLQISAVSAYARETGITIHKYSGRSEVKALRSSKFGMQYKLGEAIYALVALAFFISFLVHKFA